MRKLGYLFLVAALGSVVLAPALVQADESRHHRGNRGHVARPAPPQLSYTPQHVHNYGHQNHWKPKHRRHWHRHGPKRHWGHWKRRHHWKGRRWGHQRRHTYRPRYAPQPAWAPPHGGRRYSRDSGTIDFNINYRLFF